MDFALNDSFGAPLDFGDSSFSASTDPAASGSHESHTVSPRDLLMDMSAPNSNALTNMTTPSLYDDSPEGAYEASPLFGSDNFDGSSNWPPLFDNVEDDAGLYVPARQSFTSAAEAQDADTSALMERTNSSTSSVDVKPTDLHRMSLTSGISKQRRVGRDLGPIEVVDGDTQAFKRAKNTLAARKSRQKKRDIEEGLRVELAAMTAERDRWMHTAIAHGAAPPESKVASPTS
ncbi:MAG: hypothetical protein M1828_001777 [Chrysothrix sp. TS-e1954]|nr:MAG: hypothetical protein M1828_001777 [Chrysothrix sp. TS-e1954]